MKNTIKRDISVIRKKALERAIEKEVPSAPKRVYAKVKKVTLLKASDCEITELRSEATWDEWKDSEFLRDFDSACTDTEPMQLHADENKPMLAKHEFDDIFKSS